MEKEIYESPEITITMLFSEDIITASNDGGNSAFGSGGGQETEGDWFEGDWLEAGFFTLD